MELWQLFTAFLRVGFLSVGGGYILIPLIEQETVRSYSWLTQEEFAHVLGLSQSVPGAISVKFATYTGFKVGGFAGMAAANMGILLPPVLLMGLLLVFMGKASQNFISNAFLQGVKFGTFGLLGAITLSMGQSLPLEIKGLGLAAAAFIMVSLLQAHPGVTVVLAGIAGVILFR